MAKSIIKEIIIILLLLLAVVLALGIFFYDYIPTNKTVSSVPTYSTSETVRSELTQETADENSEVLVTYEITAADLKTYDKKGDYQKGKANPFATYEAPVTQDENSITNTSTNTLSGNTSTTNTKSSTFYGNTGTK